MDFKLDSNFSENYRKNEELNRNLGESIKKLLESNKRFAQIVDDEIALYKENRPFIFLKQSEILDTISQLELRIEKSMLHQDKYGLLRSILLSEYDDLKKQDTDCILRFKEQITILKSFKI